MQIIKGKYNLAKVMIDEIDIETRNQIQGFCNNPSFTKSQISIMPDCHAGAGSCIGFTMQMNDRIIPDIVGVDIGCGMLSYKFDTRVLDAVSLDNFIKKSIPSGFSIKDNQTFNKIESNFVSDSVIPTCTNIGMEINRAINSIGTLGGGNHFIEAGYGSDGFLWITIHSGSRNFGLQIAKYHSEIAKELCKKWGSDTQGIPFLLVDSKEGIDYIFDQRIAVEYARLNRLHMMKEITGFLGVRILDSIESVHNFIDNNGMIRKGATPAHKGQKVIIPFNMRDGLAICTGLGNKSWNESAPHGAGRLLSRSKAKETLDAELFAQDMKAHGIWTTTANQATLDESPEAYKDFNIILDCIKETVSVDELIKPIYNFKSS